MVYIPFQYLMFLLAWILYICLFDQTSGWNLGRSAILEWCHLLSLAFNIFVLPFCKNDDNIELLKLENCRCWRHHITQKAVSTQTSRSKIRVQRINQFWWWYTSFDNIYLHKSYTHMYWPNEKAETLIHGFQSKSATKCNTANSFMLSLHQLLPINQTEVWNAFKKWWCWIDKVSFNAPKIRAESRRQKTMQCTKREEILEG